MNILRILTKADDKGIKREIAELKSELSEKYSRCRLFKQFIEDEIFPEMQHMSWKEYQKAPISNLHYITWYKVTSSEWSGWVLEKDANARLIKAYEKISKKAEERKEQLRELGVLI